MTRTEVLDAVQCPSCSAPQGKTCQGRRGDRERLHAERWKAAGAFTQVGDTITGEQILAALSPEMREQIERRIRAR